MTVGGGHRPGRAARLAAVGAGAAAWLALASRTLAASPAPSSDVIGDPRAGQAAGFVGDPLLAIVIVAVLAVASIAITLAWIRATGGPAGSARDG